MSFEPACGREEASLIVSRRHQLDTERQSVRTGPQRHIETGCVEKGPKTIEDGAARRRLA